MKTLKREAEAGEQRAPGEQGGGGELMMQESGTGLTVREVAAMSGLHVQTVRRYIRDGELPAEKLTGDHGPEWRVKTEDANALARAQQSESAQAEADLRRTDSILTAVLTRLTKLQEGQRALQPSEKERQERAERERRVEEALAGNAQTVRDLTEDLGRVKIERDQARETIQELTGELQHFADEFAAVEKTIEALEAERDRLRTALERERSRSLWQRLTGKG